MKNAPLPCRPNKFLCSTTDVVSLLTPAADSLAPARSALTGLRLRRIPIAAFPSSNSLLVERRRAPRWDIPVYFRCPAATASIRFQGSLHELQFGEFSPPRRRCHIRQILVVLTAKAAVPADRHRLEDEASASKPEEKKYQGDHGRYGANYRCCLPALAGFVSPHSMGPGKERVWQNGALFKENPRGKTVQIPSRGL